MKNDAKTQRMAGEVGKSKNPGWWGVCKHLSVVLSRSVFGGNVRRVWLHNTTSNLHAAFFVRQCAASHSGCSDFLLSTGHSDRATDLGQGVTDKYRM